MRAALLIVLAAVSWGGDAFGVWKLNRARSTLAANQKTMSLRIEPHIRGEVFTLEAVTRDGRASTSSTILYFDGKARQYQDSSCSGTQLSRRLDSQTVVILRTCDSGAWTRLVRRLSTGPGEMVFEITEQQNDGRRIERRVVLEKDKE